MENQLKQQLPEFSEAYPSLLRESWMNIFQVTIRSLITTFVARHFPETKALYKVERFKRRVALDVLNQLMPLTSLMSAIKLFGHPKSLVFINQDGQAIDLLEIKELDQNEMFNQILDNLKSQKIDNGHE